MTPRQAEVFDFIRDRIEKLGFGPNLEEIAQRFHFSKPRASVIVRQLVGQGQLIRRGPGPQGVALPGHIDLSAVGTDALRAELARRGVTMDALEKPSLLSGEGRPCAANHCFERVQRGYLFCKPHWFGVPVELRSTIWNAFRARDRQAYQDAVEAARDHLGGFTLVAERVE